MIKLISVGAVIVAASIWMFCWDVRSDYSAGRERSPAAKQPSAEVVRQISSGDKQSATATQPSVAVGSVELRGATWTGGEARPSTDWLGFPRNKKSVRWLLGSALEHDFSFFVWRNQTLNPSDNEVSMSCRSLLPIVFQKCLDYRNTARSRIQAEYDDLAALADGGRPAIKRVLNPVKTAQLRKMLESMYPDPKELSLRFEEAISMSTTTWELTCEYQVIVHHDRDFYGANYDELPQASLLLDQEKMERRLCVESLVGLFQLAGALTLSEANSVVLQITSLPLPKGAR